MIKCDSKIVKTNKKQKQNCLFQQHVEILKFNRDLPEPPNTSSLFVLVFRTCQTNYTL